MILKFTTRCNESYKGRNVTEMNVLIELCKDMIWICKHVWHIYCNIYDYRSPNCICNLFTSAASLLELISVMGVIMSSSCYIIRLFDWFQIITCLRGEAWGNETKDITTQFRDKFCFIPTSPKCILCEIPRQRHADVFKYLYQVAKVYEA